jgi:hypothetical protein
LVFSDRELAGWFATMPDDLDSIVEQTKSAKCIRALCFDHSLECHEWNAQLFSQVTCMIVTIDPCGNTGLLPDDF